MAFQMLVWFCPALKRAHRVADGFVVGVHPHNSKDYSDIVEAQVEEALSHPANVGIGEIGLDYHCKLPCASETIAHTLIQTTIAREMCRIKCCDDSLGWLSG